ncbi:HamA C-terminal domain-containing protein [Marinobacter salarius]|uniref:HamA C-terminal domain-containing protein n=1 Tax=Marinobacter salarius TaxID=1420917 RepID=UPI000F851DA5|nr:DUF1837 domain-containing protein [Marinobacter salarius]AZR41999.1 hypothetical protein MTMN5_02551 [Marinobacter salarius]
MDFEVIINDSFVNISDNEDLFPVANKWVLSLINEFEDGHWRYKKFQSFIWDNIAETALSFEERKCLVDQSHSILTAAAQNLRLTDKEGDIGKGSELAEIVLYGIMKNHYKALPVVPKIFYKQNSQDNAKGADGVHIVVEGGDFSLWFGEAKFYTSIEDARLSSIIESVGNSLKTDKMKKENSIITNVSDIDGLIEDVVLKEKIRSALSNKKSIDDLKRRIHVPIFILHECELTAQCEKMSDDYRKSVIDYHKDRANSYFKKQIANIGDVFGYEEITFHIILFPVPSKDEIVSKFVKNVEHYKEQ